MKSRYSCILAEDEADQRRELRRLLARLWPDLQIVAECEDGDAAIAACRRFQPNVAFLDIRLPGRSGLDVAVEAASTAHIVFVTAYDEFAVQAFRAGAVDYLLKPVEAGSLAEAVARVRARLDYDPPNLAGLISALNARQVESNPVRWITAGVGDSVRMIALDDVVFFRSMDKYTCVATLADRAYIRTPLKELMPRLDPDVFWQVHRNAIVRVSAISHVRPGDEGGLKVWMKGISEPIAVSEPYRHLFRQM